MSISKCSDKDRWTNFGPGRCRSDWTILILLWYHVKLDELLTLNKLVMSRLTNVFYISYKIISHYWCEWLILCCVNLNFRFISFYKTIFSLCFILSVVLIFKFYFIIHVILCFQCTYFINSLNIFLVLIH